MNCPQCQNPMIKAQATDHSAPYDYCRTCKKELAEMQKPINSNTIMAIDAAIENFNPLLGLGYNYSTPYISLAGHPVNNPVNPTTYVNYKVNQDFTSHYGSKVPAGTTLNVDTTLIAGTKDYMVKVNGHSFAAYPAIVSIFELAKFCTVIGSPSITILPYVADRSFITMAGDAVNQGATLLVTTPADADGDYETEMYYRNDPKMDIYLNQYELDNYCSKPSGASLGNCQVAVTPTNSSVPKP